MQTTATHYKYLPSIRLKNLSGTFSLLKSVEHSVDDLKHQCSQIFCKKSFVAKC